MTSSSRTVGQNGAETTRKIADHLRASGKMSEALGLYHHLLRQGDEDHETLGNYVACARALNHDPASALDRVLRAFPDADHVRTSLIQMSWRNGDHRRVRDLVDSAPDIAEVDWFLYAAASALRMNDDVDAERLYGKVAEIQPGNESAVAGLARINARKRDFAGVLDALDAGGDSSESGNLNSIGLRMSAHRRLGRTGQAARAASEGLGGLIRRDELHDAARLLDRLNFPESADIIRNRIRSDDSPEGRTARRRLAGQLLVDGRISESIAEFRGLGGRRWQQRLKAAQRDAVDTASRALGVGERDPDWYVLEQTRSRLPDAAFHGLLEKVRRVSPEGWDAHRVLLVTGTLGAGGAERQLALTATGLSRRGAIKDWPQVAALQDLDIPANRHLLPSLEAAGIAVHALVSGKAIDASLPLRLAWCDDLVRLLPDAVGNQLKALCHLIVRIRPGVVHGWQDATGAVAALAALMCGVPVVVIGTRSVAPDRKEGRNRPWLRDLIKGLLADPRVRLINNSVSGALDYSRWLNIPPERIVCLPNGFEVPELQAVERQESDFVVGGVMRLTEEKQPHLWLDTLLALIRQGRQVRGLLVGDGPMMAELAGRIAEEQAGDLIELAGRQEDMPVQYARMDVMLLTSRTEGLPNVLVEAQAHRVPVISTDAGGARETFVDGQTGFLCTGGTVDEIVSRTIVLMDDPVIRRRMGDAGAQHARDEFGLERMLDRTAAIYGWPEGKA